MVKNGLTKFAVGQKVFAKASNGAFYVGIISKVGSKKDECFVVLDNEQETKAWIPFTDLHINNVVKKELKSCKEIICCLCRGEFSEHPNEIVLCDECGHGFHQLCHNPVIEDDALEFETEWKCQLCNKKASSGHAKRRLRHSAPPSPAPSEEAVSKPSNRLIKKATRKLKSQANTNDKQIAVVDNKKAAKIKETVIKSHTNNNQCHESELSLFQTCNECGEYERWFDCMLTCRRCRNWFHCKCIKGMKAPFFCGNRFFMFVCASCNHGNQLLRSLPLSWSHLGHLAMFNLCINDYHRFHCIDEKIMPWINHNWKHLHISPEYSSFPLDKRKEKLVESLRANTSIFRSGNEVKKRASWWGLREFCAPPRPYFCLPTKSALTDQMALSLQVSYIPGGTIQRSVRQQFFKRKASEAEPAVNPPPKRRKVAEHKVPPPTQSPVQPEVIHQVEQDETPCSDDIEAFSMSDRIPSLRDFEGGPHPFLTPLECEQQQRRQHACQSTIAQRVYGKPVNGFTDCAKKRSRFSVDDFEIIARRSSKQGEQQYLIEFHPQ